MGTIESPELQTDPLPSQESGCQPKYYPPEFVGSRDNGPATLYCCYLIELKQYSYKGTQLCDVILASRTRLEPDDGKFPFELNVDGGSWVGQLLYIGDVKLSNEVILRCQMFQVTVFRVLLDHNLDRLGEALGRIILIDGSVAIDYLLLPSTGPIDGPLIDWNIIGSVLFPYVKLEDKHSECCSRRGCSPLHTKNGLLYSCLLENCLVSTPHNDNLYCITGILDNFDGNSVLKRGRRESVTYKEYYKKKHEIDLCFETQPFLNGKRIPKVLNYLSRCEARKTRESSKASMVELPPEVCAVIMLPMPFATLYSFSCVPSIMHRIESLLVASSLKKMCTDHSTQNVIIPTPKILEAITTNFCQENFHLESLETLGDSFLKYASSQQVFKTYQNDKEGLLTDKRNEMISNSQLCKLACNRKIPGFIRNELFDPKTWVVPGDCSVDNNLEEDCLLNIGKIYSRGKRNMRSKMIADVIEALIGAFLSSAGEVAALSFLKWLGLGVDFINVPIISNFPVNVEELSNIKHLESLLNYTFRDLSLLVEAMTHRSYVPHGIRSYQRLEFLGDAVLDYAITAHFYYKYPGLSPGELTDLRSASVNNDCYALSSVKAGLHNYILHKCNAVQSFIDEAVQFFEQLSSPSSTFGWELDTSFNKNNVTSHPVNELTKLCQKRKYIMRPHVETYENGEAHVAVEVVVNGAVYRGSSSARGKRTATRLACKNVLKLLRPEAGA